MYFHKKLILLLPVLLLGAGPSKDNDFTTTYDKAFQQAGARHHVPWRLLRALCSVESSLDSNAYVHRDGGPNDSIGLCQVQVGAATEAGVRLHQTCSFGGVKCELWDAEFNIDTAARYLRYQFRRYGTWDKAVISYNAGSIRLAPNGEVVSTRYLHRVSERVRMFEREERTGK